MSWGLELIDTIEGLDTTIPTSLAYFNSFTINTTHSLTPLCSHYIVEYCG